MISLNLSAVTTVVNDFCSVGGCSKLATLSLWNSTSYTQARVDSTFCSNGGCADNLAVVVYEHPSTLASTTQPTAQQCATMLKGVSGDWVPTTSGL